MSIEYNLNALASLLDAKAEVFEPQDNPCFDQLVFSDPIHVFVLRIFNTRGMCILTCKYRGDRDFFSELEFTFSCGLIELCEVENPNPMKAWVRFVGFGVENEETKLVIARCNAGGIAIQAYGGCTPHVGDRSKAFGSDQPAIAPET